MQRWHAFGFCLYSKVTHEDVSYSKSGFRGRNEGKDRGKSWRHGKEKVADIQGIAPCRFFFSFSPLNLSHCNVVIYLRLLFCFQITLSIKERFILHDLSLYLNAP